MNGIHEQVNIGGGGGSWSGRFVPRRPSAFGLAVRLAVMLTVVLVALPALALGIVALALVVVTLVVFFVLFLLSLIISPFVLMISRLFSPAAKPAPIEPADDGRRNVRVVGSGENAADDT